MSNINKKIDQILGTNSIFRWNIFKQDIKNIFFSIQRIYLQQIKKQNLQEYSINSKEIISKCKQPFDNFYRYFWRSEHASSDHLPSKNNTLKQYIGGILWIVLEFDDKFSKKQFCKILGLNYNRFLYYSNFILKEFYTEGNWITNHYKENTLKFLFLYTKKLDCDINNRHLSQILNNLFSLSTIKEREDIVVDGVTQKDIRLREILSHNGFDVKIMYKEQVYHLLLPKYTAAAILYSYLLQKKEVYGREKLGKIFDLSPRRLRRAITYLGGELATIIGTKKSANLWRPSQVNALRQRLNNLKTQMTSNTLDFIADLYDILDISEEQFVALFEYSTPYASRLIRSIKEGGLSQNRYLILLRNIEGLRNSGEVSEKTLLESKELITNRLGTKEKQFHHTLRYDFKYNEHAITKIKDIHIRRLINNYMSKIYRVKYPIELFRDASIRRCSHFLLTGDLKHRLSTETIEEELIASIKTIKKTQTALIKKLKNVAWNIEAIYSKRGEVCGHPSVLQRTINEPEVIAVETPIYFEQVITGHIDLICYDSESEKILIIDYKTKKSRVIKCIIQVLLYAYLFSNTVKVPIEKIECVLYTSHYHLHFEPKHTLDPIITFIKAQNNKRYNNLKTRQGTDILDELVFLKSEFIINS
ncbi:MAG: hypothetical protein EU517_01465 [Promethearchaeota archaeon]|nr:MAG: hypothetical protein EU517_01465 [Candidatus Lokiarchaeota archaeon]